MNWQEQITYLRELSQVVQSEGLSELEVEGLGVRLNLKAEVFGFAAPAGAAPVAPAAAGAASTQATEADAIISPIVGIFYRALTPDDPPLIEVGDTVEIGQVVGLVEAMKVFNEITSEIEGTVVAIPAQNAQLVEPGSTLILVGP